MSSVYQQGLEYVQLWCDDHTKEEIYKFCVASETAKQTQRLDKVFKDEYAKAKAVEKQEKKKERRRLRQEALQLQKQNEHAIIINDELQKAQYFRYVEMEKRIQQQAEEMTVKELQKYEKKRAMEENKKMVAERMAAAKKPKRTRHNWCQTKSSWARL